MQFIVTGTDTDIGKTVACAWLCRQLGYAYWKPVQSGASQGTDTQWIQQLGIKTYPEKYCFQAPLSPHLSAPLEGMRVDESLLTPPNQDPLIIEGAGGILVPLNENTLVIDWIATLQLPTLVIAATRLGTINHTLLTLEALARRSIPVLGVILNGEPKPEIIPAIEHFGKVRVLCTLPQWENITPEALDAFEIPSSLQLSQD